VCLVQLARSGSSASTGAVSSLEKLAHRVNLSDANFYGADLSLADLSSANLVDAALTDTKLYFAHFNDSNLSNAKLGDAMLHETHFDEAMLTGAQFSSYIVEKLLTEEQLRQINLIVLVKGKTYRIKY
jgi:uncharacterized protein YjbI with pentapeptide repeats